MKKIAAFLAVVALSTASFAYAACTSHTIIGSDGKVVFCTTCCDSRGNCTSSCF